jgi:hypothetical protein
MMHLEVFTSRRDYVLALGKGVDVTPRCDYMPWLWNAYELLGVTVDQCINDEPIMRYIGINQRLRRERSIKTLLNLKNELTKTRSELRKNCTDELLCLSNRIYEYSRAINALYRYYLRLNDLSPLEISKLSIALTRYNLPTLGLEVYDELLRLSTLDELKYLTFLSMLNPIVWPTHITVDTKVLPHLNWILAYFNDHYLILIISLGRAYIVSDLDININGGRSVLSNDYEVRNVSNDHVIARIESRNGHGLLFIGNWSAHAIEFSLDFKPREGSVKGMFLDVNLTQLVPIIIPPRDYLSIKYNV